MLEIMEANEVPIKMEKSIKPMHFNFPPTLKNLANSWEPIQL